jgi:hypothetical protein
LATDLKNHVEICTKFKDLLDTPVDVQNEKQRLQIVKIILKSADLANPSKPFPIARYWANMIQEEFFLQVRTCSTKVFTQT